MARIQSLDENISLLLRKAVATISALSEAEHQKPEGLNSKATTYTYDDEIQRLEIWTSEHGVHHGRLDYKLREASLLRDRVLSLLTELSGIANNIFIPGRPNQTNRVSQS